MPTLDRRQLLQLAAALTGGAALGACSSGPGGASATGSGGGSGRIMWWDQFQPIAAFEKQLFADFGKAQGVSVEYTTQNPENMGKALQLAFQSKQMPDVFTLAGIDLPTPQLKDAGWVAPLDLDDAHLKMLPKGTLIEGLNMFGGKPYAFPIFTFRSHDTLTWFNTDLFTKAGLDPTKPPRTYDGIRQAALKIKNTGGDGVGGWIAPIKLTNRLQSQILQMSMAAGFPGRNGMNIATGEYQFEADEIVNAIEFWIAMKKDGSLFAASTGLDARTARARWATGAAGFFFDGSYNVGVINGSMKPFLDKLGIADIPIPQESSPGVVTSGPANSAVSFWLSPSSQNRSAATALIAKFLEESTQVGIAEAMDQPPLISAALAKAKVQPTYTKAVQFFDKEVFLGPIPEVRNPDVTKVASETKQVTPNLGDIVAGAVTGEISDWKAALKKLSSDSSAAREAAITAAKAKGAKVSLDDWKFPDWKPGVDYVTKAR